MQDRESKSGHVVEEKPVVNTPEELAASRQARAEALQQFRKAVKTFAGAEVKDNGIGEQRTQVAALLEELLPEEKEAKDDTATALAIAELKEEDSEASAKREKERKEKAETEKVQKLEVLRVRLRKIMEKETEAAESKAFCDEVFKIQLLMAQLWTLTELDEDGEPQDAVVYIATIPLADRVPTPAGYIQHKKVLTEWYGKDTAYTVIRDINFRVMRVPPTAGNLPTGVDSAIVLVQANSGAVPTALYFVDKSSCPAVITQLEHGGAPGLSTLLQKLYPAMNNHAYMDQDKLSPRSRGDIVAATGSRHLIKCRNHLGGYLNAREIAHLRAKGVPIKDPSEEGLYDRLTWGRGLDIHTASDLFLFWSQQTLEMNWLAGLIVRLGIRNRGAGMGVRLGIMFGAFVALVALLYVTAFVPPLAVWILIGMGVVCGGLEARRGGLRGFFSGLCTVVAGGIMLYLAAYLVPLIITVLGATAAISATAVASASAIYSIIQLCIPVLAGVIAAIREYFNPGAMKQTFEKIYYTIQRFPLT